MPIPNTVAVQTSTVAVFDLIVRLVEALVWPVLLLLVLVTFEEDLREVLKKLQTVTIKIGQIELTLDQFENAVRSTASLGIAAGEKRSETTKSDTQEAQEITAAIIDAIRTGRLPQLTGKAVLWVDDKPDKIELESQAFQGIGINTTTVRSTKRALEELREQKYDLVISDYEREPDKQAAFTLLERMQEASIETPLVIYTPPSRDVPGARERGALGVARSPRELLTLVLEAT